jgi:hypothetical protein
MSQPTRVKSMLEKLIGGTKYIDKQTYGRRSDDTIMYIQEPVGYMFFSHGNIEKILTTLRKAYPGVQFDDIQDVMLGVFYQYASSLVRFVKHENKAEVNGYVNRSNALALNELIKRFGHNNNMHTQYQGVLDRPNKVGELPVRDNPKTRTQENPYYGRDVKPMDLPKPAESDDVLGLHFSVLRQ